MSRGSKPGERRGGRQRGTPNKTTALRNAAFAAAAANPDISPLDFLLGIMRDPNVSLEFRIKVAQATLPFVHAKLLSAPLKHTAGSAKLIDGTGGFTVDDARARVEGLGESPEGPARSRILELELKGLFRGGPSAAEQIELDVLRGRRRAAFKS